MGKYIKLFETHSEYEAYITGSDKILPNVSYCEDNDDVHYNPWTDPRLIVKYNVTDETDPIHLYLYYGEIMEGITVDGAAMFDKVEIDGTEVSIADLDTAHGQYQFSEGEHTVKYTLKDPTFIGLSGDSSDPTSIEVGATFVQCRELTSVTIPNSVTLIGESAFTECGHLPSVTIPDSVTYIGSNAFALCYSLTSVTIGNSVIAIGDNAFSTCQNLTSVTIGNSVTGISSYAFYGCIGLTSVTIGNSVTTIDDNAFQGCSGLTSITSMATTAPTIQSSTFRNVKTGGTLYVPSGSTGYNVWMGTGDNYLGKYSWTKVEQ